MTIDGCSGAPATWGGHGDRRAPPRRCQFSAPRGGVEPQGGRRRRQARRAGPRAGVVATLRRLEALLALRPDCIVHTARADTCLFEAMPTSRLPRAGVRAVLKPAFFQHPAGARRCTRCTGGGQAARPGVTRRGPTASPTTAAARDHERERTAPTGSLHEVSDGPPDHQPEGLFDITALAGDDAVASSVAGHPHHGAGERGRGSSRGPRRHPGNQIVERHERVPDPEAFDVVSGRDREGHHGRPCSRFEARGVVGGETKFVLEYGTRPRDDLAPDPPSPRGTAATGS